MSEIALHAGHGGSSNAYLERYCRNHGTSLVASLLVALLLVVALWTQTAHVALLSWAALIALSQAGQFWYSRCYLRARSKGEEDQRDWMPGFLFVALTTGICWSASLFLLGSAGLGPVAMVLIFTMAGVSAYAVMAKASVFLLAFAFELAVMIPTTAWLFMQEGPVAKAMGGIALLYLGLIYFFMRQANAMAKRAAHLGAENEELAVALSRVKTLESEGAMFRSMFELIADPAVAVHDPRDGLRIVYANDAACRHFGADREILRDWRPAEFDTGMTPEKAQLLREGLARDGNFVFESTHRRADGTEVPVEVVLNTFRHEDTELLVSFVRNIAPRIAAEQRLRELEFAAVRQESDQRMARYFDCAPGIFFTLRRDRDGVMSMPFAGGSIPSFQGLTPAAVSGNIEPMLALCHPDDIDPLLEALHRSAQDMTPCRAEFRLGDPAVGQLTMELNALPRRYADEPGVVEWHGFMHEVSKRKALEEQLGMKGYALDHSSEAVYMADDLGRFVYVNEQACRALGYSRDELLALGIPDIDPTFPVEMLQDRHAKILAGGGSFTFETRHRRRDGSSYPVEIHATEIEFGGRSLALSLVRDITERKRAEDALLQSETKFRTLYDSTGDAVMLLDEQGFFDCNASTLKIFGCATREEFCTKHPADLSPPVQSCGADSRMLANQHIEKALKEGSHRFEWVHWHAVSHEIFPAEVLLSSMVLDGKSILQATVRDITERKRMEEAMAARERDFRSLAENMPDNIARWDTEGRYLYVNPTHEQLLGVKLADLLGQSIPESHAHVKAAVRQVVASGQAIHAVRQAAMVGGVEELHDVSLVPEFDETGKVISVLGIGRDMTNIYRMQEAIAAREQEFRSLAESAPDNIVRYDREGRCRYLNERLLRQLGLASMDETIGKRPGEVWPDGRFAALEEAAARVVASGERAELEVTEPDGKGGWLYHLISIVAERNEQGEIVGTIAFGRNVTHLRSTERLMQMVGDHLPGAVTQYRLRSDLSGELLYASQGLQELYGVTREMLADGIGPMIALIHPDDLPKAVAEQEHAAKTLTTAVSEFRVNHPAKGEIWVQQITTPVPESEASQLWYSLMFDITERKRLEISLAAREAEFRSLAENSPDVIFRYDRDCRRIYVNKTVELLTGKTSAELLGRSPLEYAPETGVKPDRSQQCIRAVLEGGKPVELEMNFTAVDGRDVTIHNVFVPEFAADGSVQSVLCLGRDVSERKRMEEDLKASEKRFRESGILLNSVLESASDVIVFALDRNYRYIAFNNNHKQTMQAIWGKEISLGMNMLDVIGSHDDAVAAKQGFDRTLAGESFVLEEAYGDEQLSRQHWQNHWTPIRSDAGEVIGLTCYVLNITERKQAEEKLREKFEQIVELNDRLESHARLLEEQTVEMEAAQEQLKQTEAWYRGILHSAPDGMMVVDEQGFITQVNAEMERMFGYAAGELAGQAMEVLLPADMRHAHVGMRNGFIGNAVRSAVPLLASNLRASRKDGSEFVVDVTLSRLPENEYAAGAICAAVRDVTQRQQAETELHQLNDRLEEHARLLEEQTVEMEAAQEQLKDALDFTEGVLNAVPDILFEVDREGRYLNFWLNDPSATEEQKTWMLGKTVYEMLPAEVADMAMAAIREADETGRATGKVLPIEQQNGEIRWYEHSLAKKHGGALSAPTFIVLSRDITERRLAEMHLGDLKERLHGVLQTIPDMVWLKDIEGVYLACNHPFERFFGAKEADIVGKTDYDFVDAELADFFRRKDMEAIEANRICINEEWVTLAETGQQVLLETRKVPLHDANGKVVGVLGIGRDITESKQAQDALIEREAFLDSLFNAIPVPVFYKDSDGRYLGFNRAYETFYGTSREQLVGKSVFDTHPRELAEIYHAKDAEVFEGSGETQQYESKIKHANGSLRDVFFSKAAFFDAQGHVKGLIGAVLDITERKANEEALRDSETFLRSVLDAIPIPVFYKDRDGRYLGYNKTYETFTGATPEKVIGKTIFEFTPREVAEVYQLKDDELYEQGGVQEYEFKIRSAQGELRDAIITKALFTDSRGEVRGLIGAAVDISERKQMEESLALREREFRTLVEHAADTVVRYGKDMRRTYANPAFTTLLKKNIEEVIGTKPTDIPGGPNAGMFEENLAEVLLNGKEIEFEFKWIDLDGKEICSLVNLTPEFGKDGEVESVLSVGRDISELHAYRAKIHQMAFFDTLTSLPNRALFNDRLRQMIADASWHGQLAGVMMIDMDRFKEVNDTMGHPVGDELLRETASRLSASVRAYDTVARLGGDEFAILLPEVRTGDDLGRIASKILSAFNTPFLLGGKEVFISGSIGIALYPDDSVEADDLVRYADSAMYFAKRSGRNNFRFYSKELTASANDRLSLESELRRAIERKELHLYYQPKIDLTSGAVLGSEALLRWKHPQLGMVPPNHFIDVAEDSGLIVELGEWVLREACRTACEWNASGRPLHKVAINLSARQFQTRDLVSTVYEILDETGCYPEWVELEITESLLLDEDGRVLEMLNAFRAMGITIAIDDFGTGYSALSYLARFPIDTLKIDRSFVKTITEDNYRAELVKAILSIAHCLGQKVVAEGVETVEQAAFLQAHGCQVAQGFLYSRPVPKPEAEVWPRAFDCLPRKTETEGKTENA